MSTGRLRQTGVVFSDDRQLGNQMLYLFLGGKANTSSVSMTLFPIQIYMPGTVSVELQNKQQSLNKSCSLVRGLKSIKMTEKGHG